MLIGGLGLIVNRRRMVKPGRVKPCRAHRHAARVHINAERVKRENTKFGDGRFVLSVSPISARAVVVLRTRGEAGLPLSRISEESVYLTDKGFMLLLSPSTQ